MSTVAERTCPSCLDVVPEGFTLDDHFNCNFPEDFAAPLAERGYPLPVVPVETEK